MRTVKPSRPNNAEPPIINRCCICGDFGAYGFFPRGIEGLRQRGRFYCSGHAMALAVEIGSRLSLVQALGEADAVEMGNILEAIKELGDAVGGG